MLANYIAGWCCQQSHSRKRRIGCDTLKKTRTSERMVEILEFYVIKSASGSLPALCAECATGDAVMISPEQAATIAQVSVRAIYRWVEGQVIHYRESPGGALTVCVK